MKEFKKIIIGIVACCIILVCFDMLVGYWSEKVYFQSKYGIFHRQVYYMTKSTPELLILGSSRANHQYVSSIFEDSLGLSTYNAGSEGMCIYYHYAILDAHIERGCIPKYVLLDVYSSDVSKSLTPVFTLDAALDRLAPHYGIYPGVDSIFKLRGWQEDIKMKSKTYRYNSKFVQLVRCNFVPVPEDRGYEVVNGKMPEKEIFRKEPHSMDIDFQKVAYFEKLIGLCKKNNITLLTVYSPIYFNSNDKAKGVIQQITKKNDVPFWDYSNDPAFMKRELFRDITHLHDGGARIWSSFLSSEIKKKYNKMDS